MTGLPVNVYVVVNVDCGHYIAVGNSRDSLAGPVDKLRAAGNHSVRLRHLGRGITSTQLDQIRADIAAGVKCQTCEVAS